MRTSVVAPRASRRRTPLIEPHNASGRPSSDGRSHRELPVTRLDYAAAVCGFTSFGNGATGAGTAAGVPLPPDVNVTRFADRHPA